MDGYAVGARCVEEAVLVGTASNVLCAGSVEEAASSRHRLSGRHSYPGSGVFARSGGIFISFGLEAATTHD